MRSQNIFMRILSGKKAVICICAMALLFRLAFFIAVRPWEEQTVKAMLQDDALSYFGYATFLVNSGSFAAMANGFRTPGYPVFLAGVFAFFGERVWIALLVQILLDVGTVLLVFRLATVLFVPRWIALTSAALYALSALAASYAVRVDWVIPFAFVFMLAMLAAVRGLHTGENRFFGAAGFGLGVATLVGPITQFFPFAVAVAVLFMPGSFLTKLRRIAVLLVVFFAVLSVWQIRNLRVFGHYALTTAPGYGLCRYSVATVKANVEGIEFSEARNQLESEELEGETNPFERSRIYRHIALDYIRQHPREFLRYFIRGNLVMYLGTSKGDILGIFGVETASPSRFAVSESPGDKVARVMRKARNEYYLTPILGGQQLIGYAFLAVGLVGLFRGKRGSFAVLFLLMLVYWGAVTGVMAVNRYRVPIIPAYIPISVYGFAMIRARAGRRDAPSPELLR